VHKIHSRVHLPFPRAPAAVIAVQNSDLIIVLEHGVVCEQGTHLELIAKPGGRYAELVMKMQH
jgi:ABC-type transport system involved in cytochrome bd biosynthesis fused ATPase/permease subunit